jgi:hypothetical protein
MTSASQELLKGMSIWVGMEGVRMELMAFNSDLSTQGKAELKWGVSEVQTRHAEDTTHAVSDLLQNKLLTHALGIQGEWEVRTTLLTNRQPWRYHSTVLLHGKEARKEFPPIEVDQTHHTRPVVADTEEMISAFAREAVEVHFSRCASVTEYSLMTSIYSKPAPRLRRIKKFAMVLFIVVVLLPVYWWWQDIHRMVLEPPVQTTWRETDSAVVGETESKPLAHSVWWQSVQVTQRLSAGEPFEFPLPALERVPGELPVEVTLEASEDAPRWLEFDRERLSIRGTAPVTTADQTYQLSVRAHAEAGSDSRLLILLAITGQPNPITPTPKLRGHWTW